MTDFAATITVRIIKSFEYKNFRSIIFNNVNLHDTTLEELCEMTWERIRTMPNLKQFERCNFDTVKLYYQAHGAKTNNPMINVGGDESLVIQDYKSSLYDIGFRNETEVSYFNKEDYERYKLDPTLKW